MGGSGGRRRMGFVLVFLVVATSVVACGGGQSEQAQAQELILGAAQATYAAGTAQVSLSLEGLGDGEGGGQVDFAQDQSETTLDLPAGPATVFVDGPDVLVQIGDPVTLLDPDHLDAFGSLRLLLLLLSPGQVVQLLNGLDGDVDIVGPDPVDGVDATHYRLTVSLDAVLDALDGDARDVMADLLAALGLDTLDVDVWLDDDGRVIRLQTDLDLGDDGLVTVTVDYQDFGSDVEIAIPEVADAVDATAFGLATADLSGDWTTQNEIVSSTDPAWQTVGPLEAESFTLTCDGGACGTGVDWTGGNGRYVLAFSTDGDCTDPETGEVVTPGGYHEEARYVWTVTAAEGGRATAMTVRGTVDGSITPAGQADECEFPGGGFTAHAVITGEATPD